MTRTAVVSGAGSGIGRAVALALAADCRTVVVLGRRRPPLEETARAVAEAAPGTHVEVVTADLREPDAVRAAAARVEAVAEAVDVLVNNAGGNFAPGAHADLDAVRESWRVNVEGNVLPAVLLTHALLDRLRRPGGRVVTVGSIAAFRGPASYGGAKAALHAWSAELATSLAGEGVTVNVVAPGFVDGTEFYGDRAGPELRADRARRTPAGRMGRPEEIAGLVRYLAGEDAGFVTGQILQANGGALLGRG